MQSNNNDRSFRTTHVQIFEFEVRKLSTSILYSQTQVLTCLHKGQPSLWGMITRNTYNAWVSLRWRDFQANSLSLNLEVFWLDDAKWHERVREGAWKTFLRLLLRSSALILMYKYPSRHKNGANKSVKQTDNPLSHLGMSKIIWRGILLWNIYLTWVLPLTGNFPNFGL